MVKICFVRQFVLKLTCQYSNHNTVLKDVCLTFEEFLSYKIYITR